MTPVVPNNLQAFGPLWTATQAEAAILRMLAPATQYPTGHGWLNTYLAEIEDRAGLDKGTIVRPRQWQADIDVRTFPEGQIPAIVVIVGDETPLRDGHLLHSWVDVAVGVIVRGTSRQEGRNLARWYAAAVRGAMMHHTDMGGAFARLRYSGVAYGEVAGDPTVFAATATVAFEALITATLDLSRGPDQPTAEPTPPDVPDWPEYPGDVLVDETIVTPIHVTDIEQ